MVNSAVEKLDAQAVIPSVESKQSAPLETAHRRNNKTRLWAGFIVNGGVVNLNGIKHTKSKTLQSQITGNLQGILSCFSPLIPPYLP